ncbi:hypothetical protein ACJZ2D_015427 [Fusarium nematophilum]
MTKVAVPTAADQGRRSLADKEGQQGRVPATTALTNVFRTTAPPPSLSHHFLPSDRAGQSSFSPSKTLALGPPSSMAGSFGSAAVSAIRLQPGSPDLRPSIPSPHSHGKRAPEEGTLAEDADSLRATIRSREEEIASRDRDLRSIQVLLSGEKRRRASSPDGYPGASSLSRFLDIISPIVARFPTVDDDSLTVTAVMEVSTALTIRSERRNVRQFLNDGMLGMCYVGHLAARVVDIDSGCHAHDGQCRLVMVTMVGSMRHLLFNNKFRDGEGS